MKSEKKNEKKSVVCLLFTFKFLQIPYLLTYADGDPGPALRQAQQYDRV